MRIDRPINYTGSDVSKGVRVQFPGTQGDTFIRFLTLESSQIVKLSVIRRESTREERAEVFSRKFQGTNRSRGGVGGEKSLLCYPGSELRRGVREKKRAKIINGMEKKKRKEKKGILDIGACPVTTDCIICSDER